MMKIFNKIKRNEQNLSPRRIFVIFIIILFLFCSISPLSYGEDWTMYRKNLENNGYTESKVTTTNNIKWIKNLNGEIFTSPIIADGKVFVAANNQIIILDEETGEEINNISVKNTDSSSSLLYYQDKIYYGSGGLNCYNATNGTMIWHKSGSICGSPIYFDGKVFYNEGYKISALDPNTGVKIWENELNYDRFGKCSPSIDKNEDLVFICVPEDGPDTEPAIPGIWCAILGFDIDTGEQEWEMHFDGYHFDTTCVVENGYIYINHGYVINISSKEAFTEIIPYSFDTDTLPVITENRSYCAYSGGVLCINVNGTLIWEYFEEETYFSSPTVTKNQVLIGNSKGWIYSIDKENGKMLWSFKTEGNKCLSPVVADGYIFVATDNGYLYCFDEKDESKGNWIFVIGSVLIIIALIILVGLNRYVKKRK